MAYGLVKGKKDSPQQITIFEISDDQSEPVAPYLLNTFDVNFYLKRQKLHRFEFLRAFPHIPNSGVAGVFGLYLLDEGKHHNFQWTIFLIFTL